MKGLLTAFLVGLVRFRVCHEGREPICFRLAQVLGGVYVIWSACVRDVIDFNLTVHEMPARCLFLFRADMVVR
jgi:hypothetical protein